MDAPDELLVLKTVAKFEAFGGASVELVAWELGLSPRMLREPWAQLTEARLLDGESRRGAG